MAITFLKKGAEAHQEMEKADVKQAAAEKNRAFRFWMPDGAEKEITFLDGDLTEDGLLDIVMYYEHQIFMNGAWTNWFVCTGEQEPCPICEGGDTAALVGAFTIIDHSEWKDKKGVKHKDEKKLFVAKRPSIKQLQVLATKRKGLAGCTFDAFRTGDQAAAVGNVFDFTEKQKLKVIKKKYSMEDVEPYDYEDVIQYMEAKELRKLGFGSLAVGEDDEDGEDDDPDL